MLTLRPSSVSLFGGTENKVRNSPAAQATVVCEFNQSVWRVETGMTHFKEQSNMRTYICKFFLRLELFLCVGVVIRGGRLCRHRRVIGQYECRNNKLYNRICGTS